jgi:hypothetical protein
MQCTILIYLFVIAQLLNIGLKIFKKDITYVFSEPLCSELRPTREYSPSV